MTCVMMAGCGLQKYVKSYILNGWKLNYINRIVKQLNQMLHYYYTIRTQTLMEWCVHI